MRWHIFLDVLDVKEEVFASLHADLQLDQIHCEGRSVFEGRLAQPVVWAFIFADTHVGETTAERIEFSEVEVGERRIGGVGGCGSTGINLSGASDGNCSLNGERLLFASSQHTDVPGKCVVIDFRSGCVGEGHLTWQRSGDHHISNGD